jgi:hypothetical protein
MKIKLLMTGLLGLVSAAAFAQKGELSNAKDQYGNYDVARLNKVTMSTAAKDLSDAKTSIDKASVNEKTANLPATFAVKGAIYSALTLQDTVPATSLPNFKIADEAIQKAKSLDSAKQDKDNEKLIDNATRNLAQYKFNEGRSEYQDKKYTLAYSSFDYARQSMHDDTTQLFATGLSAANAGSSDPKYYDYAITNYNKLLATNYSENPQIYSYLASIYLIKKDTADAFKTVGAGVAKYPANNDLRKREIEIGLQSGKQGELIGKIESAISNDPKNKTLYYYEGLTYSQIAESYDAQKAKTKDVAAKSALEQKETDSYNKAGAQYLKALAIDPNYLEANLNMGYVSIKPAIDMYNEANQLPTNKQKEYDAEMAKATAQADIGKPYLLKAVDINPKSTDALQNLKTYYLVKKDVANANATQKKIDALGSGK